MATGKAGPGQAVHIPVLAEEVVAWLCPRTQGWYLDCTVGLGGTAERILQCSGPGGMLIGLDHDPSAIAHARARLHPYRDRVRLMCENFRHVTSAMRAARRTRVDGILFDLGLSSAQLAQPERGFSFQQDGPLDMRMNPDGGPTADVLVNTLPETHLASIIHTLGEERYARRIARAIVRARRLAPLRTTMALSGVVRQAVPRSYRGGRLHPATRTFQAFRLAVNDELGALTAALGDVTELLAPGGRLCVIAFHSLEDRVVKHAFRRVAREAPAQWTILTKKPVVPAGEERTANPRARSAKLRVMERAPAAAGAGGAGRA